MLFQTPFTPLTWHNFAVQVDWTALTLGVFYSKDAASLEPVTAKVAPNKGHVAGETGKGDFHFGVLKVRMEARSCSLDHVF